MKKTIKNIKTDKNIVIILFNGQNGTKINWEYGFNGTPNLPKLDFLNELKKIVDKDDIKVIEHYPFFQFMGHSAYIYYKDILIAKMYHHYNRC